MVLSQDEKSTFKFARLKALTRKSQFEIFEKILKQEGDIDYAVPVDSTCGYSKQYLIGYTALHLAYDIQNTDLFLNLLSRGADFTKRNADGNTVLHMLIRKYEIMNESLENSYINAVFSAHVTSKNFTNPCDEDGLSHFHIACMTNNSTAVQFFLENGTSVDETTNMDARFSPGYTPLHFTALRTNPKIAELLLAHGANMHIADAREMTPLHLLVERRMQMYDSTGDTVSKEGNFYEKLQKQRLENENIINMLLMNMSSDNDSVDNIGLSTFHVACMLQDTAAAQHLVDRVDLDHCVNVDSRLWPGYTALHFAAHVSIDTVEMLMKAGADIEKADSKGQTPLDLCIERYKRDDICRIMSLNANWKDNVFSDGETKLLSLIRALADQDQFKEFLNCSVRNINMRVPVESPLWPGYTLLHLAVLFAKRSMQTRYEYPVAKKEVDDEIIRLCLENGADLSAQDSRGRTALHLAFRLGEKAVVEAILEHSRQIPSVSDDENLSHLHIVCATSCKSHLQKCALSSSEVSAVYEGTSPINYFVRPGSTPLHVCFAYPHKSMNDIEEKVAILLTSGADLYARDAYGLTPIHWLLDRRSTFSYYSGAEQLLERVTRDCVAEDYGLSYLHVACKLDNQTVAKRLIENGASVNLAIKCARPSAADDPLNFLSRYDRCTPLHIGALSPTDIRSSLVQQGADVFARETSGESPLDWPPVLRDFARKTLNDRRLRSLARREFGWTRLHLACHLLETDGFKDLLKAELADVNARVFANSPVWKGCTPLHLLMYRAKDCGDELESVASMSRVLLEHGADVVATGDRLNTPIGVLFENANANEKLYEQASLLMEYHRDFNVNSVDAQGVSHFHVACYVNDLNAVRGFIEHGSVDVNRPIGFLADWRPGCTPLHLASQLQVVELLIDRGADVHAEDVRGCSVLAEAIKRDFFDEDVIETIVECGADVKSSNFSGQTPFEIAITAAPISMQKLMFCIYLGCLVNSCNPFSGLGHIATVLAANYRDPNLWIRIVTTIMNANSTTVLGRTTLHHIVAGPRSNISTDDYVVLFEKSMRSGDDVDEQDVQGKTALHLAVEFTNPKAVLGLLACGADVNVLDKNGKPALFYALNQPTSFQLVINLDSACIVDTLRAQARDLSFLKLDLCKINADAIAHKPIRDRENTRVSHEQVDASKSIDMAVRSLRLYDFLSETGAVSLYPSLNQSERCKIDQFFKSINNFSGLNKILSFLKLQYRKAVKRMEILPSATNSFRSLLGFDLPDLCAENLFQYLSNSDLNNIINAEIENEAMKMDVDL